MRRFNRYKRPSTRIHASSGGIKWYGMHGERKLCYFFSDNDAYGSCEFCWRRQTSLQSFHGLPCPSICYFARRDHETEFVSKLPSRLQLPCIKLLFQVPVAFHCKGTPLAYANTRPHSGNTTNTVSDYTILSDGPLL